MNATKRINSTIGRPATPANISAAKTAPTPQKVVVVEECLHCLESHNLTKQTLPAAISIKGINLDKFNAIYDKAMKTFFNKNLAVMATIGAFITNTPVEIFNSNNYEFINHFDYFISKSQKFTQAIKDGIMIKPPYPHMQMGIVARILGQNLLECQELRLRMKELFEATVEYEKINNLSKIVNDNLSYVWYEIQKHSVRQIPPEQEWDYSGSIQCCADFKKLCDKGLSKMPEPAKPSEHEPVFTPEPEPEPERRHTPVFVPAPKESERKSPVRSKQDEEAHARQLASNFQFKRKGAGGKAKKGKTQIELSQKLTKITYTVEIARYLDYKNGEEFCKVVFPDATITTANLTKSAHKNLVKAISRNAGKRGNKDSKSIFLRLNCETDSDGIKTYGVEKVLDDKEVGSLYFDMPKVNTFSDESLFFDSAENIEEVEEEELVEFDEI